MSRTKSTVRKSPSTKTKECKEFHYMSLKSYGMECNVCGKKVIWEEKIKK